MTGAIQAASVVEYRTRSLSCCWRCGCSPPAFAGDRPPNRQAHVRVPQSLQRVQVPDGRGDAEIQDAERRTKLDAENRALYPKLRVPAASTDVAADSSATVADSVYPPATDSSLSRSTYSAAQESTSLTIHHHQPAKLLSAANQ